MLTSASMNELLIPRIMVEHAPMIKNNVMEMLGKIIQYGGYVLSLLSTILWLCVTLFPLANGTTCMHAGWQVVIMHRSKLLVAASRHCKSTNFSAFGTISYRNELD